MDRKKGIWVRRGFVAAFVVLTSLCWCPWAYGTLTGRMLSIPAWAVVAYIVAAALFVLEWVFLFFSGLAVNEEDLSNVLSERKPAGPDAAGKEGE